MSVAYKFINKDNLIALNEVLCNAKIYYEIYSV